MSEDVDAKAEAEERSVRAEAQTETEAALARVEVLTDCLEVARECEGTSSSVYERIKDRLEDAKAVLAGQSSPAAKVALLEEQFAEDRDNEALRRELHAARVRAGWSEFRIDTVSGVDPRTIIPWVATREAKWDEEWSAEGAKAETPPRSWLETEAKAIDGGHYRVYRNPRACTDGKWRREVIQQIDVVAVEDLAHLRSIVERMEDLILYKPDETGLARITIFDQRSH